MADESTRPIRKENLTEAGELGMWFAALRSLFSPQNQPGGPRTRATERDYACEALVLREILFRCLQLIPDLSVNQPVPRPSTVEASGAASPLEPTDNYVLDTDALSHLSDDLKGICALCEATLAAGLVRFDAWDQLGGALNRVLTDSHAARALISINRESASWPSHEKLTAIIRKASDEEAGEDVQHVFEGFSLLLADLDFIQASLAADAPLKPLLAVFALVNERTRELLDFIEQVTRDEVGDKSLREALDGTAYAVRMELRKTFEQELEDFCAVSNPAQTFSRAESACGLLRNCFQQSVVAVAHTLDPAIEGRELFDSFQTRFDESLKLRSALWSLISFAREAERHATDAMVPVVTDRLYAFREGSLRYLMYKDREPFEKFLEEAETARNSSELSDVMHRLGAFLETLFGQVNMRAVLAEHPFNPNEDEIDQA